MGIPVYLAMTAAEIASAPTLPEHPAYMACHFSPYGSGLSNLPDTLPAGSMLILNDRTPISGHNPQLIAGQLAELCQVLAFDAILLDFQRPGEPQTAALCKLLTEKPAIPVGVSDLYARELDCPVFVSPVPPDIDPKEHLAPWRGRELWLDAAISNCRITVSGSSSVCDLLPWEPLPADALYHDLLHCRYTIQCGTDAEFHLSRGPDEVTGLLEAAKSFGVTRAIGLYQEFVHAENGTR